MWSGYITKFKHSIIIGKNESGKTSLLEDVRLFWRILSNQGNDKFLEIFKKKLGIDVTAKWMD